ncbi:MAG: ABC-2 transporter permease [Dorea sp.]|nr:ABC-2 transporter permease [Dorea sp.]
MRALLIKDWKLLANQKQFFMVTAFIVFVFLFTSNNPEFVVSYATIMYTVFTISTISYDDYNNGMAFLFTLPVSRREYVAEKYSFGILSAGITAFVVLAVTVVMSGIRGDMIKLDDILIAEMTSIMIAMMFLSFTIPVQLKFGTEKGRIAMMAVSLVVFILIWGGVKTMKSLHWSVGSFLRKLDEAPVELFVCVVLAVCAVLMLVSAAISLRVLKQREF